MSFVLVKDVASLLREGLTMPNLIRPRKHLSFDPLMRAIRQGAEALPDARVGDVDYSIADAVMSAVAMFSLKDPSLLAFEQRRNDYNMKNLYLIANVPSDTSMREILDALTPDQLRPLFTAAFRRLQRGGALKHFVFHENCYLLSLDGTEYFSSQKIHCDSCLERKHKTSGETTYYHQSIGAVLVHPDVKQVTPLPPNPSSSRTGIAKTTANETLPSACFSRFARNIRISSSSWWKTRLPVMVRTFAS